MTSTRDLLDAIRRAEIAEAKLSVAERDGIILTRREAQAALGWYADAFTADGPRVAYDVDIALAERLAGVS